MSLLLSTVTLLLLLIVFVDILDDDDDEYDDDEQDDEEDGEDKDNDGRTNDNDEDDEDTMVELFSITDPISTTFISLIDNSSLDAITKIAKTIYMLSSNKKLMSSRTLLNISN